MPSVLWNAILGLFGLALVMRSRVIDLLEFWKDKFSCF